MPRGVYPRKKREKKDNRQTLTIPKKISTPIGSSSQETEHKIGQLLSDLELVRKVVKQGLLPESIMGDIAAACHIAIRQVVSRKLMS